MQEIKHNLGSSEASAEASLSYFHKIFGQMEIKEVEGEEEAHVPRFEVAFKLFSQLEKLRMGLCVSSYCDEMAGGQMRRNQAR